MNIDLSRIFSQVTTGTGVSAILAAVTAVASGQLTWTQAAPVIVGGVVAIIWPENKPLQSASQSAATDLVAAAPTIISDAETIISAFKSGMAHAAKVTPPQFVPVSVAAGQVPPGDVPRNQLGQPIVQ
jgi:hypothetical protein